MENNSPQINVHLYNWMISCNIIILEVSNADIIDKVYSNITITIMGELYQLSIHIYTGRVIPTKYS